MVPEDDAQLFTYSADFRVSCRPRPGGDDSGAVVQVGRHRKHELGSSSRDVPLQAPKEGWSQLDSSLLLAE